MPAPTRYLRSRILRPIMTDDLTYNIVAGTYPLREHPDFDTRFIVDPSQVPAVNLVLIDVQPTDHNVAEIRATSLLKLTKWSYLTALNSTADHQQLGPTDHPTEVTNVIRFTRALPLNPTSMLSRPTTPSAIARAQRKYNRFIETTELERLLKLRDEYLRDNPDADPSTPNLHHQIATMDHHISKRVAPLIAAAGSAVGEKVLEKLSTLTGLASEAPTRDDFKELKQSLEKGVDRITDKLAPISADERISELDKHVTEGLQALRGETIDDQTPTLHSLQTEVTELRLAISKLQTIEDSMAIEEKITTLNNTVCRILLWLENRPICPWPWPPSCP